MGREPLLLALICGYTVPKLSAMVWSAPRWLCNARGGTGHHELWRLTRACRWLVAHAVGGTWQPAQTYETIIDPLNGESFIEVPLKSAEEVRPFVASLQKCPKSGVHNPFKNVHRSVKLLAACTQIPPDECRGTVAVFVWVSIQSCGGGVGVVAVRYVHLGAVSHAAAAKLQREDVADFFAKLIQRVSPTSYKEARKEVTVTAKFLENFSGDQVP